MTTTVHPVTSTRDVELLGDALTDYVIATATGRATAAGAPEHIAAYLAERGYRIADIRATDVGLPALEVLAPIITAAGPEALDAWITVLARLKTGEQAAALVQTIDEFWTAPGRSWLRTEGGRS